MAISDFGTREQQPKRSPINPTTNTPVQSNSPNPQTSLPRRLMTTLSKYGILVPSSQSKPCPLIMTKYFQFIGKTITNWYLEDLIAKCAATVHFCQQNDIEYCIIIYQNYYSNICVSFSFSAFLNCLICQDSNYILTSIPLIYF